METAFIAFDLLKEMAEHGNPNSITDAAVGTLCARTAIEGAFYNVRVNAAGIEDQNIKTRFMEKGNQVLQEARIKEKEILDIVETKLK
jgi:glutamate formiminotransferase/formiminotetrahydrofolate cyclodeaminase